MEAAPEVIVVGGGLAGLAAAMSAKRAGATVTLLEGRSEIGGRARTEDRHGFRFNQGPHALYLGGDAVRVLREFGVRPNGSRPPLLNAELVEDSRPRLARNPRTLGWQGARALTRGLRPSAAARADGQSLAAWLNRIDDDPTRDVMAALFRITSYLADPATTDAAAALTQMRLAMRGVVYLHDGWGSLVNSLRDAAVTAGVTIEADQRVTGVQVSSDGVIVSTATGNRVCRSVVLANGGAAHADRLVGSRSPTLTEWAAAARPATAACLDIALRRLPNDRHTTLLGTDRPTYLVVHTKAARLAPPEGGELLHALWYEPDLTPTLDHRVELEGLLDSVQPGWRAELVDARYSRRLVVCHDRPRPHVTGAQRPDTCLADLPGVHLAGDWITTNGLLADAAVGSGRRAGVGAARAARSPIPLALP